MEVPYESLLSHFSKDELRRMFIDALTNTKDIKTTMFLWDSTGVFKALGLDKHVQAMKDCQQNPAWHSEGSIIRDTQTGEEVKFDPKISEHYDKGKFPVVRNGSVWDHTLLVMDEVFKDKKHDWRDLTAALLHDSGKPVVAEIKGYVHVGDTWKATKGHDVESEKIAREWLTGMGFDKEDVDMISWLCGKHMVGHEVDKIKSKLERWQIIQSPYFKERLTMLVRSDTRGSINLIPDSYTDLDDILKTPEMVYLLNTPVPEPMVSLCDLGKYDIKEMDSIVEKALKVTYALQIDQGIGDKDRLLSSCFGVMKSIRKNKKNCKK